MWTADEEGREQVEGRKPEFEQWDSYSRFTVKVRTVNRYVLGEEERLFLDTVLATIEGRDRELKKGKCSIELSSA